ncbi:MAG: type II toxin-antitoxin system RelE/ParE family toxin [Chthoniobacterales bacterium]
MESFEIRWRTSTKKDLRRIPRLDVERLLDAVAGLGDNPLPHGSDKLAGADHTYRIRVGDYRVVYELLRSRNVVEIQRVRHRREVYRR